MSKNQKIISNERGFEEKKKRFLEDGKERVHVLADFDRTLTYGLDAEGKRTATVISQLRSDPKYLGEDYMKEAHRLFDIYHPIEIDNGVPLKEKQEKMHEWWKKHFELIAKVGLTKGLINEVVEERPLRFREGAKKFLNFLNKNNIPLIIMSAASGDMITEYLKKNNLLFSNVHIISNLYEFDSNGKALKIKEPIIHTFNKTEVSLENTEVYDKMKDRKNVILLGDSLGDIGMIEGFDYDNLIKIGFLNENVEENFEEYKNNFDVIMIGDGDFSFINNLMEEIIN